MTLSKSDLSAILTNMRDVDSWHPLLEDMLPKYDITTKERIAAFLAQTGHESAEYNRLTENLNYSANALNAVFGKYFGSTRNANNYARQPEKIANVVYANRMGNGGVRSGDGWKYRGRGVIQLTGHDNYEAFAAEVNMLIDEVVDYLETKKGALHAALWYWDVNNLNSYADDKDLVGMTKRINGGTNGLKHRTTLYNRAMSVLPEETEVSEYKEVELDPTNKDFPFPKNIGMGDKDAKGDLNGPVHTIQRIVKTKADGYFGPNTKRAVKAWQSRVGLRADGVVGPNTWKTMAPFADL